MDRARTVAVWFIGAFAFGVLVAAVKDPSGDGIHVASQARSALGNLSAPWLILPFAAGFHRRSHAAAAACGLLITAVALVGFYVFIAARVHLDHRGFLGSIPLWLQANLYYLEAGLVSGPAMGLLGRACRGSQFRTLAAFTGVALLGEPLVLLGLGAASGFIPPGAYPISGWELTPRADGVRLLVYGCEFAAGALMVLAARTSRADGTPAVLGPRRLLVELRRKAVVPSPSESGSTGV